MDKAQLLLHHPLKQPGLSRIISNSPRTTHLRHIPNLAEGWTTIAMEVKVAWVSFQEPRNSSK